MANPDVSREAAHRRYARAAQVSAEAGSSTQAGLLDAYKNLLQNTEWKPDEGWAQNFQEGVKTVVPESVRNIVNSQAESADRNTVSRQAEPTAFQLLTPAGFANQNAERAAGQEKSQPVEQTSTNIVDTSRQQDGQTKSDTASRQKSVVVSDTGTRPIDKAIEDAGIAPDRDTSLRPSVQRVEDLKRMADEFNEGWQGSPAQLAALEREFAKWQEDWNNRTAVDDNAPFADMQKRAKEEVQRRFTDMNTGELRSDNPLGWNFLGFTSQQQTPTAARNLYDWHFRNEDANAPLFPEANLGTQTMPAWLGRKPPSGLGLRNQDLMALLQEPQARQVVWDFYNKPVVDENAIDDGKSPDSREALMMTGEQYLKYRNEFGIPGRDVEDIDPNELYNKQREQEQFGFIPYITSEESLDRFHDAAAPMMVSDAFNDLANLRRNLTDFTLNYDGGQVSGKDFVKSFDAWNRANAGKSVGLFYSQEEAGEGAVPQALVAVDKDGNEYVAPNAPIEENRYDDGRIQIRFNDDPDDDWWFDNQADYDANLGNRPAKDGEWTAMWEAGIPSLVLDGGQEIPAAQAVELARNMDDYADYGFLDLFKPSVEDPFKEGGLLPWMIDMTLSSSPYFFLPASGAKAAGDAMNNAQGFMAGSNNYIDGTYSMLSDEPTREQQITSTIGSAVMPATERLWGPLSGVALGGSPARRVLGSVVPDRILNRPGAKWFTGAIDEGLEEIPGNVVEDFQRMGLNMFEDSMYRDQAGNLTESPTSVDEDGNIVENRVAFDSQGREITMPTSYLGHVQNFAEEVPLSVFGGATLGGALGVKDYLKNRKAYKADQTRIRDFGYSGTQPIDLEAIARTNGMDEFMRRYYNAPSSRKED